MLWMQERTDYLQHSGRSKQSGFDGAGWNGVAEPTEYRGTFWDLRSKYLNAYI